MAQQTVAANVLNNVLRAVPYITKLPNHRLWLDYDDEADVLYVSLERPQKATKSELRDDGVLLRYRGARLVGLTIFAASKR